MPRQDARESIRLSETITSEGDIITSTPLLAGRTETCVFKRVTAADYESSLDEVGQSGESVQQELMNVRGHVDLGNPR